MSETQDLPSCTGDIFSPTLDSGECSCDLPTRQDQSSALSHDGGSEYLIKHHVKHVSIDQESFLKEPTLLEPTTEDLKQLYFHVL